MRRALQLARCGEAYASPNPMVGAVIVHDGLIIGEGFHRRCGEGHAEVNAVASVAHKDLLAHSTMYVTLEPCSHYGKTPPCAKLIIDSRIPRVIVGCLDPFHKVSGRGVELLRNAGVEVKVGVLEQECLKLNDRFVTAHRRHRPYVTLKWAQSYDGFLDSRRLAPGQLPMLFSSAESTLEVHRLRALHDAVMVGSGTVMVDDPRLDVRNVSGRQPAKVVIDRRARVAPTARVFARGRIIYFSAVERADLPANVECITVDRDASLDVILSRLYECGITSVLVEGGSEIINALVSSSTYDSARIEVAPFSLGQNGVAHVDMPPQSPYKIRKLAENMIIGVKNDV